MSRQSVPLPDDDAQEEEARASGYMPPRQVERARPEGKPLPAYKVRKKASDAARSKLTVDLTPAFIERIREISEQEGVPMNQVIEFLARWALPAYESGEIDLTDYKMASMLPARFKFFLRLEGE